MARTDTNAEIERKLRVKIARKTSTVEFKLKPRVDDKSEMEKTPINSMPALKAFDFAATGLGDLENGKPLRRSLLDFLTKLDDGKKSEGIRREYIRLLSESLQLAFGVGTGELKPR